MDFEQNYEMEQYKIFLKMWTQTFFALERRRLKKIKWDSLNFQQDFTTILTAALLLTQGIQEFKYYQKYSQYHGGEV